MITTLDALIDGNKSSLEIIDFVHFATNKNRRLVAKEVFRDITQLRDDGVIKQLENSTKWTIKED